MGIINVTPDSFFAPSRELYPDQAVQKGLLLVEQGADILDIGGESSRPSQVYDSKTIAVSEADELERVIPVITSLAEHCSVPLSIDTIKPKVAEAAIANGVSILNDITGFQDPEMVELAAAKPVDICVMHMQGNPQNMQLNPTYSEDIVLDLIQWFENRIERLLQKGVKEKQIIIDPGIGFGKTVAHNLKIVQNLPRFKALGFRLLLGTSRKSFLGNIVNKKTQDLLSATLTINSIAVLSGVDMIRVHDVAEHRDMVEVFAEYNKS